MDIWKSIYGLIWIIHGNWNHCGLIWIDAAWWLQHAEERAGEPRAQHAKGQKNFHNDAGRAESVIEG